MFSKKSEYEQEIRKDDINFWKTTNDPVNDSPQRAQNSPQPTGHKNQSGYGNKRYDDDAELPGDSAFHPIKRENVNSLWLNNPKEMDFFHNSHGGARPSNNGDNANSGVGYRKLGYR